MTFPVRVVLKKELLVVVSRRLHTTAYIYHLNMTVSRGIRQQITKQQCPPMSKRQKERKITEGNSIFSTCFTKICNYLEIDGKEYQHTWNKLSSSSHLFKSLNKTRTIHHRRSPFYTHLKFIFLSRSSRITMGTTHEHNRKTDKQTGCPPKTHRVTKWRPHCDVTRLSKMTTMPDCTIQQGTERNHPPSLMFYTGRKRLRKYKKAFPI